MSMRIGALFFEMPTMPPETFTANFNYLLTDYSKQEGGLSFVPGSHRWRRIPSAEEAEYWADNAEVIDAPAGSMVIWGDHTWHGSYPKTTDGFRLMLLGMYCRPHMQTQEAFSAHCDQRGTGAKSQAFCPPYERLSQHAMGEIAKT